MNSSVQRHFIERESGGQVEELKQSPQARSKLGEFNTKIDQYQNIVFWDITDNTSFKNI